MCPPPPPPPPRLAVKIGDGGTETADGEHGRIAKRKTKCHGSEQNASAGKRQWRECRGR